MVEESASAFRRFARQFTITGLSGDPRSFLRKITPEALEILKREKRTWVKFVLRCRMERTSIATGEVISEDAAFFRVEENLKGNDEKEIWREMTGKSLENTANFQRMGSNWRFDHVIQAELHFIGFEPLRAGTWIKLPASLKSKKAIINMKNTDDKCFKWNLNPVSKNQERISNDLIRQSTRFNLNGISFPVNLKDISKFEKNNPGFSVNVFGYEKNVNPLRVSKTKGKAVDLLLISGSGASDKTKHYCVIKNLSRLLSNQLDKYEHEKVV